MCQSVPAVNIPPSGDPRDSHILLTGPGFFPRNFCPGGGGFTSGQFFPEMNENLQHISILVNALERLLRRQETLVFIHNNQINKKVIHLFFEANATKQCASNAFLYQNVVKYLCNKNRLC